jgi:hypothetical protein
MLSFDEAAHQYFWQGKPVVNVTRVLKPLVDYSHIPDAVLETARRKGVAVHRMVELDAAGDLDTTTIPDWMQGCYRALCRFKDETGFEVWASERKLYHPNYQYAGTLDLVGLMPKLKNAQGPCLVDLKRSFYAGPVIGVQLAAYKEPWDKAEGKDMRIRHRFALRLDEDGKYRLEPFEDTADFSVFLSLLTIHNWKERHGRQ